jgi:hypothetical protein
MREFIRTYGKLAGLFAAAALVLSLLTGLLARNPFGTVLLRAVLAAVVFGGLAVGLQYVVRRFLPELTGEASAQAGGEGQPDGKGRTVDIVLPEENPLVAGAGSSPAGEERQEPTAAELEGELEEAGAGLDTPGDAPFADAVPEGEDGGRSRPEQPASTAGGGRDGLPDISDLEQPAARPGRSRLPRTSFSGAAIDEIERTLTRDIDPSTHARAIRTLLKRDEKG